MAHSCDGHKFLASNARLMNMQYYANAVTCSPVLVVRRTPPCDPVSELSKDSNRRHTPAEECHRKLPNYISGPGKEGTGSGQALVAPVPGEELARIS